MLEKLPADKQLVLFDGVCNLCNSAIQYIITHDAQQVFMFAALQSDVGQEVIAHYQIDTAQTDSILLYSNAHGLSYKSTAALKIATKLGFPRNMMGVFFIVPPFIRNWVYDFIARNRYKWYGKRDACMIPTPELRRKFLS